jgi:hypothetical protein
MPGFERVEVPVGLANSKMTIGMESTLKIGMAEQV